MKDYLSMHYYYNDDGTADEIVDSLGDCLVQSAYVILKNKYNMRNDYYKAFDHVAVVTCKENLQVLKKKIEILFR